MITGELLKKAIISAANNVANHRHEINEINVFPVPDGDTGANMFVTLSAAKSALLCLEDDCTVSQAAQTAAKAMLRASRGNSGAILCLFFRGIAKSLNGKERASAGELAEALGKAVDTVCDSVRKPTEGTMLTLIKSSAKLAGRLTGNESITVARLWHQLTEDSHRCLKNTTFQLDVLADEGVVDAGALGLVYIYEGMRMVFCEDRIVERDESDDNSLGAYVHMSDTVTDNNGIITKMGYKIAFENACDEAFLQKELEGFTESLVIVRYGEVLRCRAFTAQPEKIMEKLLTWGKLAMFTAAAHSPCNKVSFPDPTESPDAGKIPDDKNLGAVLKNKYCTELTVLKDAENSLVEKQLRKILGEIGDSVVVVEGDDIVKCHVHTDSPLAVFELAPDSGFVNDIKIENMTFQVKMTFQ